MSALDNGTAWVVNNVSDDVSVVDLSTMHVRATIRTGDEPQDVVFAGSPTRAYVSVSMEDVVKVYDPTTLALVTTVPVNGHMPRGLARNAAGTRVFASMLQGGNRTSVLPASLAAGNIPDDPKFPRTAGNKGGNPDYPSQESPRPAVRAARGPQPVRSRAASTAATEPSSRRPTLRPKPARALRSSSMVAARPSIAA